MLEAGYAPATVTGNVALLGLLDQRCVAEKVDLEGLSEARIDELLVGAQADDRPVTLRRLGPVLDSLRAAGLIPAGPCCSRTSWARPSAPRSWGDRTWRDLMERHNALVLRELKTFQGREMDTAGDGFSAVFETPERAVGCAESITAAVASLGIQVRAGVHMASARSSAARSAAWP